MTTKKAKRIRIKIRTRPTARGTTPRGTTRPKGKRPRHLRRANPSSDPAHPFLQIPAEPSLPAKRRRRDQALLRPEVVATLPWHVLVLVPVLLAMVKARLARCPTAQAERRRSAGPLVQERRAALSGREPVVPLHPSRAKPVPPPTRAPLLARRAPALPTRRKQSLSTRRSTSTRRRSRRSSKPCPLDPTEFP